MLPTPNPARRNSRPPPFVWTRSRPNTIRGGRGWRWPAALRPGDTGMDLRLHPAPATLEEQAAVDALLGSSAPERAEGMRYAAGVGHAAAREQRHLLLPALSTVQARVGWITPAALSYICERLTIPPAEAYGVASFYALLARSPQPPVV